ncbi:MAG: WD40 repeat domain-containing protein, partial [Planctomycetales bacterium]|nr:WD40 repeat domain-containing protein [Planctomycetales bacterium]
LHDTARRLYVSQVRQAATAWGQRDYGALNEFLRTSAPDDGSTDFRSWEWYFLKEQTQRLFAELPGDNVIQAAWRPKHNHIAVCVPRGDSFSVEYWKPESSARLRELISFPNPWPHAVRWSDDGARLAIGTREGRVTVVDASTGGVMFERHPYQDDEQFDSMEAIDLSPKGDILVTASTYGNIKLWNVNSRTLIRSLKIPDTGSSTDDQREKGITSIAFSRHGHELAIRMKFGRVITWNLRNDQTIEYERTGNARLAVDWHPNGKQFVSTDHNDVSVYNVGDRKPFVRFQQLDANSISWINDKTLATGGADHTIRLWDLSTQTEYQSAQIGRRPVDVCGASPDGRYLAARSGNQLQIIRLAELLGNRETILSPPGERIEGGWHSVHWSPNGQMIASGHNDAHVNLGTYGSTIRIYDVEQKKLVAEYSIRPNPKIQWSADSRWIQVIDSEGRIHSLAATEPFVKCTRIPPNESSYFKLEAFNTFTDSAISQQQSLIAFEKLTQENASDNSCEVWVYDHEALRIVDKIEVGAGIKAWSPDSKRLCLVEWDNVYIYDAQQKTCTKALVLQRAATAITWNPDSTELAIGSGDGAMHILSANGLEHRELQGRHRAYVNGLDWSPDGSRIASTARDGTLRIWDAIHGDEVAVLRLSVPSDAIEKVDWSPNGRQLAVGTRSGQILVLDAPTMPMLRKSTDDNVEIALSEASPIQTAVTSLRSSSDRIRIDDFDDGEDEGWSHVSSLHDPNNGETLCDASSGAYRLQTSTEIAAYNVNGEFAAAVWDKSSDPACSNGLIRAKVQVDSQGCLAVIAFRMSGDNFTDGYLFKANTAPRYKHTDFEIQRITDGKSIQFTKLGTTNLTFGVGEEWWIEAGGIGDQLSMKVWKVGDAEPTTPQLIVKDDTYSIGMFGVGSYIESGFARRAKINATFDDVSFQPLGRVAGVSQD